MKTISFQPWIEQQAAIAEGLLAVAVRRPDRSLEALTNAAEFNTASLGELFPFITEMQRQLDPERLPGVRHCWTFQSARIGFATRPDGATLVVLLAPETATSALDALARSFQEWTTDTEA